LLFLEVMKNIKSLKHWRKITLKLLSLTQTGNFKIGDNQVKIIIKPKENLITELFLYMPPTGKNDEKRIYAKLKSLSDGIYEGNLEIKEKGIWDLVIILSDGSAISERILIGDYDKFGF
jgi:hypothetical protein